MDGLNSFIAAEGCTPKPEVQLAFKPGSQIKLELKIPRMANLELIPDTFSSLIYPAISDAISSKKSAMVDRLNKHRRQLLADSFPAGAIVMLIDPERKNKFEPKYIGPYSIVRRTRWGAYQLRDMTGDN